MAVLCLAVRGDPRDPVHYLEEDVDATLYLNNLKDQNINFSFIYVDDGDYSPIRHLPRVEMVGGLLKEPKQLVLRGF